MYRTANMISCGMSGTLLSKSTETEAVQKP
jgi:hypothetical protein